MESRDPRDYYIKLQFNLFKEYDEEGLVGEDIEGPYKTFYLESTDGKYCRRFSTESAPKWVLQIYNKIIKQ